MRQASPTDALLRFLVQRATLISAGGDDDVQLISHLVLP